MTVLEILKLSANDALILSFAFSLLLLLSSIMKTNFNVEMMLISFANEFKTVIKSLLQIFVVSFLVISSILLIRKAVW